MPRQPIPSTVTATFWNRRTKAACFVLVLLVPELVALVTILGLLPGQGPVSYDAFSVAAVFSVLVVCDILAAFVAFYIRVTPSPAKR